MSFLRSRVFLKEYVCDHWKEILTYTFIIYENVLQEQFFLEYKKQLNLHDLENTES